MTYKEKLTDPRWQKKRLEIMNRDAFTCVSCGATNKTLHVHHLKYIKDPWDVSNDFLQTLCFECHTKEHKKNDQITTNNTHNENPLILDSDFVLNGAHITPGSKPGIYDFNLKWPLSEYIRYQNITEDKYALERIKIPLKDWQQYILDHLNQCCAIHNVSIIYGEIAFGVDFHSSLNQNEL
jgi:hypothetical protein